MRLRSKSFVKKIIKVVMYTFLFIGLAEVVLRLGGIKPFPHFNDGDVEKYAKNHYQGYMCNDDSIGIIPCPSKERTIYLAEKIPFQVSHLPDGSRYCGNTGLKNQDVLLMTGDSNTHGDGVNDADHVGFKLQTLLPKYHVINRSIPGSGTISQLMVLKNSLKLYTPKIVVAIYGSYHNDRNVFVRSIRKIFRVPKSKINEYRFPVASLRDSGLSVSYVPYEYTPFPLSNYLASAELVNLLLEKYDHYKLDADQVTRKIWEEYIRICKLHRIKLCVIVPSQNDVSDGMSRYFRTNGVVVIPVKFMPDQTYQPIDKHPNKEGHAYLTSVLFKKLESMGWLNR